MANSRDNLDIDSILLNANALRLDFKFEEALAQYELVLSQQPEQMEALIKKGITHASRKEYTQAFNSLGKAHALDQNNPTALCALAECYARIGEHEKALDCIQKALVLAPRMIEFLISRADILFQAGDLTAAEEQLNHILEQSDSHAFAWGLKGQIAFEQNKYDEANAHLHKAISLNDKLDFAFPLLGVIAGIKKDFSLAHQYFDKALALDEKNCFALAEKGRIFYLQGNMQEFEQYFQKAQVTASPTELTWLMDEKTKLNLHDTDKSLAPPGAVRAAATKFMQHTAAVQPAPAAPKAPVAKLSPSRQNKLASVFAAGMFKPAPKLTPANTSKPALSQGGYK